MLIALAYYPVYVLGPGKRFGIWFQGCQKNCPGCMAKNFHKRTSPWARKIAPETLAAQVLAKMPEGVTISGGEPFDQPESLRRLLYLLKQENMNDIIIYSGYRAEYILSAFPWIATLCGCLVDGPYVQSEISKSASKGSANQREIIFNPLPQYVPWLESPKGALQLATHDNHIFVIGIPNAGDAEKILEKSYGPGENLSCLRVCESGK